MIRLRQPTSVLVSALSTLVVAGFSSRALAQSPSLVEALDTTQLVWTTTGNVRWFAQTNTTHDGGDAAQSGAITYTQFTTIETAVTGPVSVAFWWKVESLGYNSLDFAVDGVTRGSISGDVDWQYRRYNIPAGSHRCAWSFDNGFRKDNVTPNTAWLDEVGVMPATVPTSHYVWTNSPAPLAPYTNWHAAAHVIQHAIDAAMDGDTVWVTNGTYAIGGKAIDGTSTNRVAIDRALRVRSVNGPTVTVIRGRGPSGNSAVRCAYVASRALLAGFTLTDGYTQTQDGGGGTFCDFNAVVSNCLIVGNFATYGGGAYGGRLDNCTVTANSADRGGGTMASALYNCSLTGNRAFNDGGGAYGGTLDHCQVIGNSCFGFGGGVYTTARDVSDQYYALNNCLLIDNSASFGGGIAGLGPGIPSSANNCTIVRNTATSSGSGAFGCLLQNSIVCYNSSSPAVFMCYLDHCCIFPGVASPGTDVIVKEPVFVDFNRSNFRLAGSSPCIDAGQSYPSMLDVLDLDGTPRVFNVRDIGAYEFTMKTRANLFLQGPYANGGMATALQDSSYLPQRSPYGTETALLPSNTTDWVLLELTDTNDNRVVATSVALLLSSGQVVDKEGAPGVRLECPRGLYRLTVRHRNHLGATSALPLVYASEVITYDFTTGPDKYLGGTNTCMALEPGVWGLIAGDADGDGKVTWADRVVVSNLLGEPGYLQADLNLDGKVDGGD